MLGWLSDASTLASRSNRASRSGIAREARGEDLDRDVAVERRVGRPPDLAHPALADLLDEAVMEEGGAGGDHGEGECLMRGRAKLSPRRAR